MPTLALPPSPISFANPAAFLLLGLILAFVLIRGLSLRGLARGRSRFALALRLAILALLVTGLAGPLLVGAADKTAVAFLVDTSDSMTMPQRQHALAWVRQALAAKRPADQAEVIAFAGNALVDRPLGTGTDLPDLRSTPQADRTDLAAAIRLAMSTLPSNTARRIVVLSDGAENSGSARDEARLAGAAGVPISFVPLPGRDTPEALVRQVETPQSLREQDTFAVRVVVDASAAGPAVLQLLVDGRLDASYNVQLQQGANNFTFDHAPLPKGFHSFHVQLMAPADTVAENNEGTSFSMVNGKAKVLIVEGTAGEGRYLSAALRAGGMDVVSIATANLPAEPAGLRNFDSVVLVNVPADQLSATQQRALKAYVQSLGGGLAVVGGSNSYGAGGYAGTQIEEALPVSANLSGRKLQSSVALLLVVDTSGSMGEGARGATKMDMAKKAATESISLLGPQDQFGVLSFDDTNHWIIKPQPLGDGASAKQQIAKLGPGGGTEIYPALREAFQVLSQVQAKVRHIILMTDGRAPPGDYDTLTAQMRADNITLSTIAVGGDADFGLLQRLAEQGKGRYYEGLDPFDVPQITVKETLEVARQAIVEHAVSPALASTNPIVDGLDLNHLPPLAGYVATQAKPTSTTILSLPEGDPLLAEWQYGLGRVVAWTSDAENRWAADWLQWPQAAQFWTQLVKRTIPAQLDQNLHVAVEQADGRGNIVVDALGNDGGYLNLQASEATVVDPNGGRQSLPLPQAAPGRYEGSFPIGAQGAYAVAVTQRDADGALVAIQNTGFVVDYSPEYRELGGNPDLLRAVAAQTGGSPLAEPGQAFAPLEHASGNGRELWPFLVALAIPLFLVDVGVRRLRVGTADLRRDWQSLAGWWAARGQPLAQPAAGALLTAKRRSHLEALRRPELGKPASAGDRVVKRSVERDDKQPSPAEPVRTTAMAERLMAAKQRKAGKGHTTANIG